MHVEKFYEQGAEEATGEEEDDYRPPRTSLALSMGKKDDKSDGEQSEGEAKEVEDRGGSGDSSGRSNKPNNKKRKKTTMSSKSFIVKKRAKYDQEAAKKRRKEERKKARGNNSAGVRLANILRGLERTRTSTGETERLFTHDKKVALKRAYVEELDKVMDEQESDESSSEDESDDEHGASCGCAMCFAPEHDPTITGSTNPIMESIHNTAMLLRDNMSEEALLRLIKGEYNKKMRQQLSHHGVKVPKISASQLSQHYVETGHVFDPLAILKEVIVTLKGIYDDVRKNGCKLDQPDGSTAFSKDMIAACRGLGKDIGELTLKYRKEREEEKKFYRNRNEELSRQASNAGEICVGRTGDSQVMNSVVVNIQNCNFYHMAGRKSSL